MALPKFLCIGAQKAGTSWLFAQLQSHPDVWMPPVKELQFFNHLFVPENRSWTTWHIRQGVAGAVGHHVRAHKVPDFDYLRYLADLGSRDLFTLDWYRAAFSRPGAQGKLLGDITPEYSTIPEAGIHYLRSVLGAVKVIYLIRDPLARTLSQLRMNVSRRNAEMTGALWAEMAEEWDLANRGDYRAYVPRWKAHFAPGDILFLPYGRIGRDPAGLMREVEAFLGLAPHHYPRIDEQIHSSRRTEIPDAVVRRVAERLDGQAAFLEREFGADFAAAT